MKKTMLFGLLAILAISAIGLATAYRGDYTTKGPDFSEEKHIAMQAAFESHDYSAWREIMTESGKHSRVLDVITEENFETFVLAREAGKAGDLELAAKLRSELGLHDGKGPKDGSMKRGMQERHSYKNRLNADR